MLRRMWRSWGLAGDFVSSSLLLAGVGMVSTEEAAAALELLALAEAETAAEEAAIVDETQPDGALRFYFTLHYSTDEQDTRPTCADAKQAGLCMLHTDVLYHIRASGMQVACAAPNQCGSTLRCLRLLPEVLS